MILQQNFRRFVPILLVGLTLALTVNGAADARRGGSFGSRGGRTYSAPSPSYTSPGYTPPVQRSMTPRPANAPVPTSGQNLAPPPRSGFMGGFGGGLMGGLLAGGLIGGLMGHGYGGGWGGGGMGGGLLTILIQFAVIGGLIWLGMRLFRRNVSAPEEVVAGPWGTPTSGFGGIQTSPGATPGPALQISINQQDRDAFTLLLIEAQDAFGHEAYGRLRTVTTPEVMGFLAEELSENATHGRRNEVTGTRLITSELTEAWREGDADYATVALRYESIDVMRDRTTNAVVNGDPDMPTTTTEFWTYVRQTGEPWKLSAIQDGPGG